MSIKVFGSNICPVTMRFISILTANKTAPVFVNVTGSIDHLKAFITFRDTSPLFDNIRGTGRIGFPLIQLEDGTYTRDANKVLEDLGIKERLEFNK